MKPIVFVALFLSALTAVAEEIKYSVYTAGAWQEWVVDGAQANQSGTEKIEAIKIELDGYASLCHVDYRVHVSSLGWQGWVHDGEVAGVPGYDLGIEAMEIKLDNCDDYQIAYQTRPVGTTYFFEVHDQIYSSGDGMDGWSKNGEVSGTTGQSLSLADIRIETDDYANTCTDAKLIRLDGSYGAEHNYSNDSTDFLDIDVFRVAVPADGDLQVSFTGGTASILDSDCVQASEYANSGQLEIEVTAGTYYVRVRPNSICGVCGYSSGPYDLEVSMAYSECLSASMCAQSPTTGNWVRFESSCDVPDDWARSLNNNEECLASSSYPVYSQGELYVPRVDLNVGGSTQSYEADLKLKQSASPMQLELVKARRRYFE